MENLTLFRISVFTTLGLMIAALLTPIATIALDMSRSADGLQYLEFVCVWCQYGATDNNPYGTSLIYNFTSLDFYFLWIPILALIGMSILPVLKSFPKLEISQRISDALAINILWVIASLAMLIRLSLSYLITLKESEWQRMFPDNMIEGELGWGSASLIIGAISAAAAAMFGFIEFQYELDSDNQPTNTPASS